MAILPKNSQITYTNTTADEMFLDPQGASSYESRIKKDLSNIIEDLNKINKAAKTLRDHKGTKGAWKDTAALLAKKSNTYKTKFETSKRGIESKMASDTKAYLLSIVQSVGTLEEKVAQLEKIVAGLQ